MGKIYNLDARRKKKSHSLTVVLENNKEDVVTWCKFYGDKKLTAELMIRIGEELARYDDPADIFRFRKDLEAYLNGDTE